MMSEATLLEIHVMNEAENAILPAKAMHDADERTIKSSEDRGHMQWKTNKGRPIAVK